jgi:hypothetical protein
LSFTRFPKEMFLHVCEAVFVHDNVGVILSTTHAMSISFLREKFLRSERSAQI